MSQLDPRWSTLKIGKTFLTVGRWGCALTCVCMLTTYLALQKKNPALIVKPDVGVKKFSFDAGGRIVWQSVTQKVPGLIFVERAFKEDKKRIADAIAGPNKAVLLNVANGAHWVVAIAVAQNDYVIVDPLGGGVCMAKSKYHNVVGAAYFDIQP